MRLAVALVALAASGALGGEVESTPAPPVVESGTICDITPYDMGLIHPEAYVLLDRDTEVRWYADPRVALPRSDLRIGVRVRFARRPAPKAACAAWVEVVSLDPLAMEIAVEEWVADACGGRAWMGLRRDDAAEIERLGAPCWHIRDSATRRLRSRGPDALRTLVWARRHGDPEVRARAEALLRDLGW